ncbi:oligopeptide transport system ATP-binding protein [Roseomonas rosea]|uniref:Oligopeptide transport system ATP-binding protein n=1 Tax=Muricoccus roseus TaxID=198092 RepID=A0A1M6N0R1_9PROT|nr:ABC transporter ATP-binding protein [Roseomonas rosea]SHJ89319.1 oligopeptide transport system ATP-binding protein [Roseomonas rosea]
MSPPLAEGRGLVMEFGGPGLLTPGRRPVRAVAGVDIAIRRGEALGLVGESGSGKSTIGRMLLRLVRPTAGQVVFDGQDITGADRAALRPLRRRMQMVFQDPFGSLNPRMGIGPAVAEGIALHRLASGSAARDRAASLLERVGLSPGLYDRRPAALSGGQRQRVAIARALAVDPDFVVADEPVSALDVSVGAEILNLLRELRRERQLALLFVSHDLGAVRTLCDRVAVLYLGRVMEEGPAAAVLRAPSHPYTRALLSASPGRPGEARGPRILLRGEIPSPAAPPSGCVFRTRCPYALPACAETVPALRPLDATRRAACIRDDILGMEAAA